MKCISIKTLLVFFVFFSLNISNAQNVYKYPDYNVDKKDCDQILSAMDYPNPDYSNEEPVEVYVDLLIEKIFDVSGKDMEFEAFFNVARLE